MSCLLREKFNDRRQLKGQTVVSDDSQGRGIRLCLFLCPELVSSAINDRFLRPYNCCDIVFQKGQILLTGFDPLLFRQILDICNQHELISGCVTGKVSAIETPSLL